MVTNLRKKAPEERVIVPNGLVLALYGIDVLLPQNAGVAASEEGEKSPVIREETKHAEDSGHLPPNSS